MPSITQILVQCELSPKGFCLYIIEIINSNVAIFSRAGRVVFCVPKDRVSKLRANPPQSQLKKHLSKQHVLFSEQMYEYTDRNICAQIEI